MQGAWVQSLVQDDSSGLKVWPKNKTKQKQCTEKPLDWEARDSDSRSLLDFNQLCILCKAAFIHKQAVVVVEGALCSRAGGAGQGKRWPTDPGEEEARSCLHQLIPPTWTQPCLQAWVTSGWQAGLALGNWNQSQGSLGRWPPTSANNAGICRALLLGPPGPYCALWIADTAPESTRVSALVFLPLSKPTLSFIKRAKPTDPGRRRITNNSQRRKVGRSLVR